MSARPRHWDLPLRYTMTCGTNVHTPLILTKGLQQEPRAAAGILIDTCRLQQIDTCCCARVLIWLLLCQGLVINIASTKKCGGLHTSQNLTPSYTQVSSGSIPAHYKLHMLACIKDWSGNLMGMPSRIGTSQPWLCGRVSLAPESRVHNRPLARQPWLWAGVTQQATCKQQL